MNLLLDTCSFLWMNLDAEELSEGSRTAVLDPGNTLYLSAASGWEIAVKHQLGRLTLPAPPVAYVPSRREFLGIRSLPISEDDSLHVGKLPALHRDPFDRMLVTQEVGSSSLLEPTTSESVTYKRWKGSLNGLGNGLCGEI